MDFEKIKLTDLLPAEYNPRVISDEDYEKLENSINEFGLVDPIIVNLKNNRIIGGHQRYKVLMNEYQNGGNDELILIKLGDIGWTFPQENLVIEDELHEKALNVALNKISGQWNNVKLQELLVELDLEDFNLSLTGFQEFEIDKLNYDQDVEFEEINDLSKEESYDDSDSSMDDVYLTCPSCGGQFKEEDGL